MIVSLASSSWLVNTGVSSAVSTRASTWLVGAIESLHIEPSAAGEGSFVFSSRLLLIFSSGACVGAELGSETVIVGVPFPLIGSTESQNTKGSAAAVHSLTLLASSE